ncbi:MAG: peptidylprolyl isomerase [Xanthomonadales bacterium]|nr:peptidylprolyl isomerase [Xanthomonadales bacterium]
MNLLSRLFLLALMPLAALPAQAQSLDSQPLDGIVAVVDEDVILRSELQRAVANIVGQYGGRTAQLPPRDVLERQVLDRLILIKLQAQRAATTGIRVSEPEIDGAIADVAQQNGLTIDQLRQELARDGFSFAEFRETMRDELLIQRMRQRFVQTQVAVSDSEIDAVLAGDISLGSEVRLGHILVAVPEGADSQTIQVGREKADGIRRLIDDGMEFSAAAIRYSNAPNALDGGELGWRSLNEVPVAFVELVNSLRPGETSPPVRGPAGFHIIRLHERRSVSQRMVDQYKARHIMIGVDELTSNERARARIEELRAQLQAGADFAELARAHSTDHNTAPLGGDMGWFPVDGYGSGVGAMVVRLADGELSEPFQTDVGWHIMQREGSRQQDVTESYQRAQARESIRARKAEEEWDRFVRRIRNEAYVENRIQIGDDNAG